MNTSISKDEYLKLKSNQVPHTLIDVRNTSEWDDGHIDNAINIPLDQLETEIESVCENKNQKIIVHCGGGSRAKRAQEALQELGYSNVAVLIGGYRGWLVNV